MPCRPAMPKHHLPTVCMPGANALRRPGVHIQEEDTPYPGGPHTDEPATIGVHSDRYLAHANQILHLPPAIFHCITLSVLQHAFVVILSSVHP